MYSPSRLANIAAPLTGCAFPPAALFGANAAIGGVLTCFAGRSFLARRTKLRALVLICEALVFTAAVLNIVGNMYDDAECNCQYYSCFLYGLFYAGVVAVGFYRKTSRISTSYGNLVPVDHSDLSWVGKPVDPVHRFGNAPLPGKTGLHEHHACEGIAGAMCRFGDVAGELILPSIHAFAHHSRPHPFPPTGTGARLSYYRRLAHSLSSSM
ncbi:hypothetical protein BDK51DRAFT_42873 [Blyttiomyces helicus]|uniref:Uncharacterized protein n=1 Tax=Blyttiomyces helicus TaxID=388810 RepID=A0A4P9VZM2_9FUNG|nr:hypothetical protein BDK51DRAFT_42873 [Blyttiomyces helicus]|eukprot:RKO84465.1 hypothetical protein BDK51DRAFT_42873 [Blyttiomyces helicus]